MSDAQAPAAPGAKKNGGKLIPMIVALVVTAGSVGAGAFWYARKSAPVADVKPKASSRGLIKFEPFVANLADPGGSRFLRVSVQLVVDSPAKAEEASKSPVVLMQARSGILELLTQQKADALITPEGKAELKKAIAEHVQESLEELKVIDVLFSDFVVQF